MRLMYDAVDVERIPAGWTGLVAGYLDGARIPSTLPALRKRFPDNQVVTIAVTAHQDAHVLDVEDGDARPDQVPAWVQRQRALGKDPTVYTSTAQWPAVRAACATAGVAPPHWWRAHWNGVPALEMGEVAHQYTNGVTPADAPHRVPGCDTSAVADHWPGVDPTPQGDDMTTQELDAYFGSIADAFAKGTATGGTKLVDLIAHRVIAIQEAAKR